jgi:site-specific DNA recombinase
VEWAWRTSCARHPESDTRRFGKLRRDEFAKDAGDLHRHIASGAPQITPEKIGKVAVLLRDKLRHGRPELRQAYARLVMDEVNVWDEEIRISGSKSILARCAAANEMPAAPAVLSFVQEWRARKDSNLRTASAGEAYFAL